MDKTISTDRLSLVATKQITYATKELQKSSREIVEYEIFLGRTPSSEKIGYIILCFLKEPHEDNVCLFYYEIEGKFRRRGYCFESVTAILKSLPRKMVVFADVFKTPNNAFEASERLLQKCGFKPAGISNICPLTVQYEKKL